MRRAIVYIDENYAEFSTINESHDNIKIFFEGKTVWGESYEQLKDHLGFDHLKGCYVIGNSITVTYVPTKELSYGKNSCRIDIYASSYK